MPSAVCSFDSFLLIRSMKTLGVRIDCHVENAQAVTAFLKAHEAASRVYYPGDPSAQGHETNRKQAENGGTMLSFKLKDGYDAGTFFEALRLFALAESLSGVESLVCHPASMTHASIPPEIRHKIGISDHLIRLPISLEHSDDLIADLEQAIAAARR